MEVLDATPADEAVFWRLMKEDQASVLGQLLALGIVERVKARTYTTSRVAELFYGNGAK